MDGSFAALAGAGAFTRMAGGAAVATPERAHSPVRLAALADMTTVQDAWNNLAANTIEPNVFFEPWMLLPAARAYADETNLRFLLVYSRARSVANSPVILIGLLPLERVSRWLGLPVASYRLWTYPHCYLGTPLIRAGYEDECLAVIFDWLANTQGGPALVEFNTVSAGGRFNQALMRQLQARNAAAFVGAFKTRAVFRQGANADAFLRSGIAGRHRKELRRRSSRLAELGTVAVRMLEPTDDAAQWVEQFLDLERRGWKGRGGTALDATKADRAFFRSLVEAAFRQGRLQMLALTLDGRPIAMKCNLLAGNGGFAFKIAYDEAYARFSPGVLLEVEMVRALHQPGAPAWMDSCAVPDHFMINRLWPDRTSIHSVLVATGRGAGALIVASLPLLRLLRRKLTRRGQHLAPPAASQGPATLQGVDHDEPCPDLDATKPGFAVAGR